MPQILIIEEVQHASQLNKVLEPQKPTCGCCETKPAPEPEPRPEQEAKPSRDPKSNPLQRRSVELVAERLYETYSKAVGGVAFNGDKLPSWVEFSKDPSKQKQANAWRATAEEVLEFSFRAAELYRFVTL